MHRSEPPAASRLIVAGAERDSDLRTMAVGLTAAVNESSRCRSPTPRGGTDRSIGEKGRWGWSMSEAGGAGPRRAPSPPGRGPRGKRPSLVRERTLFEQIL